MSLNELGLRQKNQLKFFYVSFILDKLLSAFPNLLIESNIFKDFSDVSNFCNIKFNWSKIPIHNITSCSTFLNFYISLTEKPKWIHHLGRMKLNGLAWLKNYWSFLMIYSQLSSQNFVMDLILPTTIDKGVNILLQAEWFLKIWDEVLSGVLNHRNVKLGRK